MRASSRRAGPPTDPYDHHLQLGAGEDLLARFNQGGVLGPAEVHVARGLGRLGGETDDAVLLAAALATRAPRVGHVRVDLGDVRDNLAFDGDEEIDLATLPWPEGPAWLAAVAASPLVGTGPPEDSPRPLRLEGQALYLDRHWQDERFIASDLLERASSVAPEVDSAVLEDGLDRLFPEPGAADQRRAAATAIKRRLSVIAGGPGTGKTTTIARLLGLLHQQAEAAGRRPPLVALAAPTGKAAARLQESVQSQLAGLDLSEEALAHLRTLGGSTLHRLLGRHPGNASRFRHHRQHRLPHDVVVVDETSMVPAALMARLLEAVRPDARLVLVGDPQQLASVEAGAVLADVVGPARPEGFGRGVALLHTNHRFGGQLAALADAVRRGDAAAVIEHLEGPRPDAAVVWLARPPTDADGDGWAPVRDLVGDWGARMRRAGLDGDGPGALGALGELRVLCAHRHGPAGASYWNQRLEEWLAEDDPNRATEGEWYPGRPVMVTANDYGVRLFNGDTGACIRRPDGRSGAVFARGEGEMLVSPSRLAAVDTVYATTVHKSQGSEFDTVVVVLPDPESRVLTRELLYTAITRARTRVVLVGGLESIRAAVSRPVARASGLAQRLWGDSETGETQSGGGQDH